MGINVNCINETLEKLGLTAKESKVYLFLAKCTGPQKGGDIATRLKIHRGEVYRILTSLQSKGVVETILNHPMGFIAVPFQDVLDLHIEKMEEQIFNLKAEKKDIIAQYASTISQIGPASSEKFSFLRGRDMIFGKSFQMVQQAKKEMLWMCTGLQDVSYDQRIKKRHDIRWRSIFNLTKEDLNKFKYLKDRFNPDLGYETEGRYADLGKDIPFSTQIQDNTSVLVILEHDTPESMTALWTNSKVFVRNFRLSFEKFWSDGIDIDERIRELESQESNTLNLQPKNL
jgi:sugar-specific transcriptional regulator TrmB